MKKYLILAVATAVALVAAFGVRRMTAPQATVVKLTALESGDVRQTVECNGTVKTAARQDVFVPTPCIAREICVKEGQRVEAGDVLFTVDTEATKQVLSQMGAPVGSVNAAVAAPVAGVIAKLSVQAGGVTGTDTPCAVIEISEGIHVAITVREKHIARLAVGQSVEVTGVAFEKPQYHGTVTHIADTAHREYIGSVNETVVDALVRLEEAECDGSLREGLNARACVLTNVIEGALSVPYNCIGQNEAGEEFVYVYRENGTAERVWPQFGEEHSGGVLVVSGLSAGDRLVQDPETLSGDVVAVQVA